MVIPNVDFDRIAMTANENYQSFHDNKNGQHRKEPCGLNWPIM